MSRGERAARWALYAAMTLLGAGLLWRADHPHYAFETDDVNKAMGHWSLRLLWACLLLSPLSRALRQPALRRWRRPLGLGAFGFATLLYIFSIALIEAAGQWIRQTKRYRQGAA